jgi:hypothetical protein
VSFDVDRSDRWHAAYYDAGTQDLKYAVRDVAGAWTIETVDATGDVGSYCDLEVTAAGTPHIAYYDATNREIKYARKVAGNWTLLGLPQDQSGGSRGQHCSIALTPGDLPIIGFYHADSTDTRVASQGAGATWRIRKVDRRPEARDPLGIQTVVAVARDGTEHVAYFTLSPVVGVTGRNLFHAERAPGDTTTFRPEARQVGVSDRGQDPSMALDEAGAAHFSFQGLAAGAGRVYYASKLSTGQYLNLLASPAHSLGPNTALHSSIAVGSDGAIYIGYEFGGALALSIREAGQAGFPTVATLLSEDVDVGAVSVALFEGSTPRIAFYDALNGDVEVAARGLDTNARRIARYDEASQTWLGLGSGEATGLDWWARALLVDGNRLLVGGAFTQAGPVDVSRMAEWNGSAWSNVTSAFDSVDPDSHIWSMIVFRGSVIAGGEFTFTEGGPGNYLVNLGL